MKRKLPVFVCVNNHFDPIWRRCWNRRFTWRGDTFVSYAEIEDYYLTDNLAFARQHPEYKFHAESAVVARKYVERHPERLAELRRLARAGRFTVSGAGDNIIDVNLVLGESIVRNFVLGLLWTEEELGVRTRLAVRYDGFGNSAQLPQVLRGCECDWVIGLSYSGPKGKYWRGLDGSVVCLAQPPFVGGAGAWAKYPPCPACRGQGCRACHHRGITSRRNPPPTPINDEKLENFGAGLFRVSSEELLPDASMFDWVRQQRARYDLRFALEEEMRPAVERWLTRVDDPPEAELHPGPELNPNNTGCYVSRIKLKQTCRRQEYALLGAETLWALAALKGCHPPREELQAAWRDLLFTMFHDAITATHVDPAYDELREMAAEIDARTDELETRALRHLAAEKPGAFSVINPFGHAFTGVVTATVPARAAYGALRGPDGKTVPVLESRALASGQAEVRFLASGVAPLSAATYTLVRAKGAAKPQPAAPAQVTTVFGHTVTVPASAWAAAGVRTLPEPVIENERFEITADEHGLVRIRDKRLRRVVSARGAYRPNELVMERDEGSPWATLHADQTRTPLADGTKLVSAEAGPGWQRLTFRFGLPHHGFGTLDPLSGTTAVTLYAGLDLVCFHTEAHWDCFQGRLRVALPVPFRGRHLYGIPYGALERKPYKPWFAWAGANGDWPAINWAGVETRACSVALLNRGLPSYRIENGPGGASHILLSVLRSPATPTYLHEPQNYVMTDWDGMRDAGDHAFDYALAAYDAPFAESSVALDAESYNSGALAVPGVVSLPEAPRVVSDSVRLAAFKPAEDGAGLIVRLAEYRGRKARADVILPPPVTGAQRVNLLERQGTDLPLRDGRVTLELRPWEIATLRLAMRTGGAR